jgi:hypothetical protein
MASKNEDIGTVRQLIVATTSEWPDGNNWRVEK